MRLSATNVFIAIAVFTAHGYGRAAQKALGDVRDKPSAVSQNPAGSPDQKEESTPAQCGPPDYKCSYGGDDAKPLCTDCALPPVPDMSAEPDAVSYDTTFGTNGGNQIVRCTYPDTTGANNHFYVIGSGGSGDSHVIGRAGGSPPSYRLVIGDTHGAPHVFTYTPDPVHPKCRPTYQPIWSFAVGDGSFSWITPHLYYEFSNYRWKALDLGSPKPPQRVRVADFQQILPRDGPDWPGPSQPITLGTIIRPRSNNAGKYLYQATCPAQRPDCTPGATGSNVPAFNQTVMVTTPDGTVRWRNIGIGFNGLPPWTDTGGVSSNDDVFVSGFSDAGGQGGPGALFVAAYKRSINTFFLYNIGTGVISYFTCDGGTSERCSGGSWKQTVLGVTRLPDRFLLHNVKVSKSGEWVVVALDSCRLNTCWIIPGSAGPYFWRLSKTETTVTKATTHALGHWTEGFQLFANQEGDPGVAVNGRTFANPSDDFALNDAPSKPGNTEGIDSHPSWNYNDGSDKTPICTITAGFDWPYTLPGENEAICFGTNPDPNCSSPGQPLCRNMVKRFFHTYNPATCDQYEGFWGCWGIGALSQDGKYYAFTSNWGDTLGSRSRGGSGPGSCRGGFNFQPNHDYKVGDVFEPSNGGHGRWNGTYTVYKVTMAGSSKRYPHAWPIAWQLKQHKREGYYQSGDTILPRRNNPCQHLFQVTAGGGSANGSRMPKWQKVYGYNGSCNPVATGATLTDGGITWTDMGEFVLGTMHLANLGSDDCRSDVFIGTLR